MSEKLLHPRRFYMVMAIEAKLEQFQKQLADAQKQLQSIEQQRHAAQTCITEIIGALKGGHQMINDELEGGNVTIEDYYKQKADFLEVQEPQEPAQYNVIEFPGSKPAEDTPDEGQSNETNETTNNDATRGDAG